MRIPAQLGFMILWTPCLLQLQSGRVTENVRPEAIREACFPTERTDASAFTDRRSADWIARVLIWGSLKEPAEFWFEVRLSHFKGYAATVRKAETAIASQLENVAAESPGLRSIADRVRWKEWHFDERSCPSLGERAAGFSDLEVPVVSAPFMQFDQDIVRLTGVSKNGNSVRYTNVALARSDALENPDGIMGWVYQMRDALLECMKDSEGKTVRLSERVSDPDREH